MDSQLAQNTTVAWVLLPHNKTKTNYRTPKYSALEAVSLANALPNLNVIGNLIVNFRSVHPGTFFGKGKITELAAYGHAGRLDLAKIGLSCSTCCFLDMHEMAAILIAGRR